MTEVLKRFEKHFLAYDEPTKSALKRLLEFDVLPEIVIDGCNVKIVTDDYSSFKRTLTLKNVDGSLKKLEGCFLQNLGLIYKKEQNKYCFYGEYEHQTDEATEPFAVKFDGASVDVQIFNACENLFYFETPWQLIGTICISIAAKAELYGEYLNEKEKAQLLLIKEIANLECWFEQDNPRCVSFDSLKALTNKYGCQKATRLLSKLEAVTTTDSKYHKTVQKLTLLLCAKEYEPLWREIYQKLLESQAEYPSKADSEKLCALRDKIQKLMESHGYIGTYPDFVKDSTLDGLHLERSYNLSYFVGFEKYAQYHIHCEETFFDENEPMIQFCCGTAFFKKDEAEQDTDIFGCMFNARGKRLFDTVDYDSGGQCDLETAVTVAVKRAECQKLTKKEKDDCYGKMPGAFFTFFGTLLVAGGMFGILMTLAMMLFSVVVCAVTVGFSEIPEMFKQMPWGLLLAIGWVGFGGALGIIEALSMRK